jgi:hypothetical protein
MERLLRMKLKPIRRVVMFLLLLLLVLTAGDVYVLFDRGGYVCVFQDVYDSEPVRRTDIRVEALPPADNEALARGIVVHGSEELVRILEDFGS